MQWGGFFLHMARMAKLPVSGVIYYFETPRK